MSINPSFGILNIPNATIRAAGVNTSVLHVTTLVSNTATVDGDINFTGNLYQNGSTFGGGEWSSNSSNISYTAGNVGIGTTDPKSPLHLQQSSANSGNQIGLIISDDQGGNSSTTLPALGFSHSNGTIFRGGIQMVGESSNLEKGMIFRVGRSGSIGGFATHPLEDVPERMRINRNGNVGIGTANPVGKFDVWDGVSNGSNVQQNATIYLRNPANAATNYGAALIFENTDGAAGNRFSLGRISALRENNSASYSSYLKFSPTSNGNEFEGMRIASNGNVGIGTTDPGAHLVINDVSGLDTQLHIVTQGSTFGTATYSTIELKDTGSSHGAWIQGFHDASVNHGLRIGRVSTGTRDTPTLVIGGNGTDNVGIGLTNPTSKLHVNGSLAKSSGSFMIDHPLPEMSNTHHLYHSFIEGPRADLIYRGKVQLSNGVASVNIDEVSKMTEGTFDVLNREVQCFTSNESDWDAVRGSVSGNMLSIECQNTSSTAIISWMVIGERQDKHMYETQWTDSEGRVIPEQLKS